MRFDSDVPLQSVHVDGYPLNYLDTGEGDPVVLVHGSLCDCRYWKPQIAPLAAGYRVISVSLRHHWPNSTDAGDGNFSIARHAQDLAALITALDLAPTHVVGHSRGGRVALELALQHPQLVRSLVLADPGVHFADAEAPREAAPFVAQATAMLAAGDIEGGLGLFVDAVNGANTWARMIEGFKRMARDNAGTLRGQSVEPGLPVHDGKLRGLNCPVLLVGGAASPSRYEYVLDRLNSTLPNVQRLTIQGAAHGMNLAKPHSFNTAVCRFLNELPAGALRAGQDSSS